METPQEIEVWYILPALRREFVFAFKDHNLKQKDIAKIMDITEGAVSQYIRGKRGKDIVFGPNIKKEIKMSAAAVKKGKDFHSELQRIMKIINETRFICEVCHEHTDASSECDICYG